MAQEFMDACGAVVGLAVCILALGFIIGAPVVFVIHTLVKLYGIL